jgi:lipopolysaccharide biosynthesis protein
LNSKYFLGENVSKLNNLCTEACLKDGNLQFPFVAGSMFWFKPNSLRILLSLDIDAMSLEYVDDQTDGTLAHAFERFFGLAVIKSGYVISEIDEKGKIDNIDVKTLPKKYPYAKATQGDSFTS